MADLLLTIVTDLRDPDMRACIFHNVDMRDKIQMLLAAGYVKRPTEEWFLELRDVAELVDYRTKQEASDGKPD